MSDAGSNQDHHGTGKGDHDTDLTTNRAVSLFASALNETLEKLKESLINHLKPC